MVGERLQVLALVPYPVGEAPGQRYRIEQWAPYLRELGIDVHFAPFAEESLAGALYEPGRRLEKAAGLVGAWWRRFETVWRSSEFDVVYLYREAALIGPALLERVTRWRNPRLVYDFDDAIWLRYVSPRNSYFSYLKAPGKTRVICRLAAAVTVGNETLAGFASRYSSRVTILPSTVSLREYSPRPAASSDSLPVIGWTGSHSSARYLPLVEGALRTLARRRRFRFVVIGVEDYRIDGVDVECRPWRKEQEVEDLWALDVGIMPLFDDPWSRAKCAMKAIQYMGAGLPVVASPVGANRDVIRHGQSGFHASDEDEWVEALERLLDRSDLRQAMGACGRGLVEAQFSAEVQAPRLAQILRDVGPRS